MGIAYRPDQRSNDIAAIGEGVRKKFEEILVPAGMGDIAIFTEMGRFMLAPYGALVTTVLHEKHIYKEYIGVDAQVSTLLCLCRVGKPMLNVCKACVLTQFLLTVPCKNHIIKMYANRQEIMKMIV